VISTSTFARAGRKRELTYSPYSAMRLHVPVFCNSIPGMWRRIILLAFIFMSALLLWSSNFSDNYFNVIQRPKHPLERLVEQGQAHFKAVTSRQSTSLSAAIKEYERRYDRSVRLAGIVRLRCAGSPAQRRL
jgi:hypothetical protein